MRPLGFWVMFVLAGMAPASFVFSSGGGGDSVPDSSFASYEDVAVMNQGGLPVALPNRNLKEKRNGISTAMNKGDLGGFYMQDYPRFDPTPSSRAAIKAGPIEHGTHLLPYVSQPTPPSHPRHGSP